MVEGLVDGGVRGRPKRGREQTLRSSLVIGADGKHSAIARQVGARTYRARAASSAACYAYFEGLPLDGGEVYSRPDRLVTLWPTNDGLTVVYLGVPAAAFPRLRADLTGGYRAAVEAVGDLRERLHAARMVEHVRATSDLPARFRRPYGKGWALAGDAGLVMDPITGQGIGNALRDADALSRAVVAGGEHFAGYHRQRDAERRPMYALTARVAAFRPGRGGDRLLRAIAEDPDQSSRFLGVLTGAVPVKDLLGPAAVLKFLAQRAGSSMRA